MPENFSISNRPSHPIDTFMDKLEDLDHKDYTISNVSMKFFKDEDGHIYLDKTDQGRLKAQMECSFTLLDNQTNEEKTIVFKQNIYGGKALKEDALDRDKIGEQNKFLYAIKTFRKICLKESLINQSVEDLLDPSNSDFKSLKSASKVKKVTITLNYDNKDQIIEGHVKGKAFSNKKFMGDQKRYFQVKPGAKDTPENHLFIHSRNLNTKNLDPLYKISNLADKTLDQAKSVRFTKNIQDILKKDIKGYQKEVKNRLNKLHLTEKEQSVALDKIDDLNTIYDQYKLGDITQTQADKKIEEAKDSINKWLRDKEFNLKDNIATIESQASDISELTNIYSDRISKTLLSTIREASFINQELLTFTAISKKSHQLYKSLTTIKSYLEDLKIDPEVHLPADFNDFTLSFFENDTLYDRAPSTYDIITSLIDQIDSTLVLLSKKNPDGTFAFSPLSKNTTADDIFDFSDQLMSTLKTLVSTLSIQLNLSIVQDHQSYVNDFINSDPNLKASISNDEIQSYMIHQSALNPTPEVLLEVSLSKIAALKNTSFELDNQLHDEIEHHKESFYNIRMGLEQLNELINENFPEGLPENLVNEFKYLDKQVITLNNQLQNPNISTDELDEIKKDLETLQSNVLNLEQDASNSFATKEFKNWADETGSRVDNIINNLNKPLSKDQANYLDTLNRQLDLIKADIHNLTNIENNPEELSVLKEKIPKDFAQIQSNIQTYSTDYRNFKHHIGALESKCVQQAQNLVNEALEKGLDKAFRETLVKDLNAELKNIKMALKKPPIDLADIKNNFKNYIDDKRLEVEAIYQKQLESEYEKQIEVLKATASKFEKRYKYLEKAQLPDQEYAHIQSLKSTVDSLQAILSNHKSNTARQIDKELLNTTKSTSISQIQALKESYIKAKQEIADKLNSAAENYSNQYTEGLSLWKNTTKNQYIPDQLNKLYTRFNKELEEHQPLDFSDNLIRKPTKELTAIKTKIVNDQRFLNQFTKLSSDFIKDLSLYNEERSLLIESYYTTQEMNSKIFSQLDFVDFNQDLTHTYKEYKNIQSALTEYLLESSKESNDIIKGKAQALNDLNQKLLEFIPNYTVELFNHTVKDIYSIEKAFESEIQKILQIKENYSYHLSHLGQFPKHCDFIIENLNKLQELNPLNEAQAELLSLQESNDINKIEDMNQVLQSSLNEIAHYIAQIKVSLNEVIISMLSDTWGHLIKYMQEDEIINSDLDFKGLPTVEYLNEQISQYELSIKELIPNISLEEDSLKTLESCATFQNNLHKVISIFDEIYTQWNNYSKIILRTPKYAVKEEFNPQNPNSLNNLIKNLNGKIESGAFQSLSNEYRSILSNYSGERIDNSGQLSKKKSIGDFMELYKRTKALKAITLEYYN